MSFDEFRERNYFRGLDGLRALSILAVILHHVPHFTSAVWHRIQENGRYGVSFFFVVSGFLICTLLLREREQHGRVAWGKFYGRRALRLLPLYYATLALQCVLVFGLHAYNAENQLLFREKLPAYVLYFSNWLATATQGPFFYAWSLAVEEQFYLGFGLLLCFVPRQRLVALLAAAGLVKFVAFQCFGPLDTVSLLWRVVFSYQEPILWGVLLAFALQEPRSYRAVARVCGSAVVLGGATAALVGVFATHQLEAQSTWDAQLVYVAMTVVVAATVVRVRPPVLGQRWLVHIGRTSYGIYLLHTFVIYALKRLPVGADPAWSFWLSAPLSIGLASVVYVTFERPIITFYKRRLSPLHDAPAPALANTPGLAATTVAPEAASAETM